MFYQRSVRKLKHFADRIRREHAIVLLPNVPIRIHNVNGGYLFSLCNTELGVYRYDDKRWGKRTKAVRCV